MKKYEKIITLGVIIMLVSFMFPFLVINIRGPLLDTPPILLMILIFTGFAIIVYGLIIRALYIDKGHVIKDERTQIIWYKSLAYTLYITIPFIIIIVGLVRYNVIKIEIYHIVWPIIIQVGITQRIIRWYLNQKRGV